MINNAKNYRADIDGLRAIAVIAVIFYHFSIFHSIFRSGFIGVDIFFVISGYLITQILVSNTNSKGWIFDFYLRRIRRIVPALVLILFGTFIAGIFLMLPYEFKFLGHELIGGSTFSSNLVYLRESGYFDVSANKKPLLHLWSLGIEEQFYIFWPILIWLISRLKFNARIIIGIFILASFGYCQLISINHINLSFYSPASRAWELGAGGFIAILKLERFTKLIKGIGNLGFLVIIMSFLIIHNQNDWPSLYTVLPIVGTLAILADKSQNSVTSKFLSMKALKWFGKISYPLYLVHWPIWVFAGIALGRAPNSVDKILLLILSVFLASLTHYLVEKPIRESEVLLFWARRLVVAMSIILVASVGLSLSNGFPERLGNSMNLQRNQEISLQLSPVKFQNKYCLKYFPNPQAVNYGWWFCRLSRAESPQILLWGNSFANQYYEGMAKNIFFKTKSILSIGDCSIQRELSLNKENPCAGVHWHEQRNFIKNIIRTTPSIEYVILAGLKEDVNNSDIDDLESALAFLKEQNIQPIVFYPHLKPSKSIYSCINRPVVRATWNCKVSTSLRDDLDFKFSKTLEFIHEEFPSTLIFDPNVAFCGKKDCEFMKSGIPLLRDTDPHMSIAGSQLVAEKFMNWAQSNLRF